MNVLFHLGHPAHFHLFRHTITRLREAGHIVHILVKKKDVLTRLLDEAGLPYVNILPEGRSPGRTGMVRDLFKRGRRLIAYAAKHRPDLLIGTSADISYAGKWLVIPAINVNEDDASVIPLHAWLAYPWATVILSPECCDNGRWNRKTVTYPGYHELAYLHPDHFSPDFNVVKRYIDALNPYEVAASHGIPGGASPKKHEANSVAPYFVLRLSALTAHHDRGIRGISDEIVDRLVRVLEPHGRVLISSERPLDRKFYPFIMRIKPEDMHHMLAFAGAVIGDSQTMSAEAGVLGTPFIRYNDFVGKIGYLRELEDTYRLGFGISPGNPDLLVARAEELASMESRDIFQERRRRMLSEKINVVDYLFDYITGFSNHNSRM